MLPLVAWRSPASGPNRGAATGVSNVDYGVLKEVL
jgi:hypothetical protein